MTLYRCYHRNGLRKEFETAPQRNASIVYLHVNKSKAGDDEEDK